MSVALSIAFTGLCALVADGDGTPAKILLLDARGVGEVAGMTFPEHAPTLAVSLRDLANPDSSSPTRVIAASPGRGYGDLSATGGGSARPSAGIDQIGLWDLTGTEVRIKAQGGGVAGLRLFEPTEGETSWPNAPRDFNDPASWRDLRFVAEMRALTGDGRIDPSVLGEDDGMPGHGHMPASIASRIELDAGILQGGIPSQERHRSDVFEFRSQASEPALRQALTDTIQWTLRTEAAAVVVEIIPVAGGPMRRLLFSSHATPHSIFISNLPVENDLQGDTHHAMSEEELTALHFAAFYKLLKEPAALMALPRPWRALDSRRGTGGIRPSTCPVVRFTRR